MAKLCSYYPLHFMQAVIIVNPRGLLYHVRGSREENGVGWCMANWKCHSYLFISTTRPLLCACDSRTRTPNGRGSTQVSISPRIYLFYTLTHAFTGIIVNQKFAGGAGRRGGGGAR